MMRPLLFPGAPQRWLALALLATASFGAARPASAQEPIVEFKRVLISRPSISPALEEDKDRRAKLEQELKNFYDDREKTLNRIVDTQLKTFGQLRQALMVDGWADVAVKFSRLPFADLEPDRLKKQPSVEPDVVASDERLRARIGDKFRAMVRRVVANGDNDSKAAIANLITEMGLTVRAAVPPRQPGTPAEVDAERRAGFARSLTPEIIELTKSRSEFVRLHALRALGGMNSDPRKSAPVLAAQFVPSNPVAVRRVAADGLVRIITIATYLKEQSLRDTPVRADKLDVLIAAGAVAHYAPEGLADADAVTRERCTEALRAGAQALTSLLQQPVYQKPSEQAKRDVRDFNPFSPAEINTLKDVLASYAKAGPRLAATLRDPSADVRVADVRTLEQLSDVRYRLAKDDLNIGEVDKIVDRVRLVPPRAADPLAVFAKGEWRLVAQLMVNDPDVRVRRAAVNFLEYFPESRPTVVGDLTRALADPDRFVRWSAARGLGYFTKDYGPKDAVSAVPALAKMLFDPDFTDRLAAAATLESIGPYAEAAVPDLARAVNFGDVENRVAAMYIIQSIGPERSKSLIGCVTDAMKQEDARVRRAAAETLGKYGPLARNPATVAALRRAMGDEDQEVRINASEALLAVLGEDPPPKQ